MYGFTQGLTSASVKEVVAAYATSAKYNFIVVSTPLLSYNLFVSVLDFYEKQFIFNNFYFYFSMLKLLVKVLQLDL